MSRFSDRLERARDNVVEQATEAAMYGSGHEEMDAAVYRYLLACGDDELAADMLERNVALATSSLLGLSGQTGDGTVCRTATPDEP